MDEGIQRSVDGQNGVGKLRRSKQMQIDAVFAYQLVQLLGVVVFFVSISDRRRKSGMVPLIDERVTLVTKCCYPFPIGIWVWSILGIESVSFTEWLTLGLSWVGFAMTIKAKLDLGERHTWAGYHAGSGITVTAGIYRCLKHPMYVGIAIVVVSGTIMVSSRVPSWVLAMTMIVNLWIVGFLMVVAQRESSFLGRAAPASLRSNG